MRLIRNQPRFFLSLWHILFLKEAWKKTQEMWGVVWRPNLSTTYVYVYYRYRSSIHSYVSQFALCGGVLFIAPLWFTQKLLCEIGFSVQHPQWSWWVICWHLYFSTGWHMHYLTHPKTLQGTNVTYPTLWFSGRSHLPKHQLVGDMWSFPRSVFLIVGHPTTSLGPWALISWTWLVAFKKGQYTTHVI